MGKYLIIGAIIAMVASIGAVGGISSVNFLQQAEAASCQVFAYADGTQEEKCSSDNSFSNANAANVNVHLKGLKK